MGETVKVFGGSVDLIINRPDDLSTKDAHT